MISVEKLKDECCGCEACKEICPVNCITMKKNEEGFLFPNINNESCIQCNKCEMVCPINNFSLIGENMLKTIPTYAAWSLDEKVRKEGASGGIFGTLAKMILKMDGIVIGAMYDSNNQVIHNFIENDNQLYKLQGSKYVQSSTNGMFKLAEEYLKKGKKVLYSGTPCQIEGLKKYLKKDYEELITVGIICHGVSSVGVYEKYVEFLEKKYKSKIKYINFRKKVRNDVGLFQVIFYNKKRYESVGTGGKIKDLYYKGFMSNIFTRKSCYLCNYKLNSDFIIGDFWGIENFNNNLNIHEGINIVLCISDKSKRIFKELENKIYLKKYNLNDVIMYNPNIIEPSYKNELRNDFFKDYQNMSIEKVLNKYLEDEIKNMSFLTLMYRIKRKIKKSLKWSR